MARSIMAESLAARSFGVAIGAANDMLATHARRGSVKCILSLYEDTSSGAWDDAQDLGTVAGRCCLYLDMTKPNCRKTNVCVVVKMQ